MESGVYWIKYGQVSLDFDFVFINGRRRRTYVDP